jgi:DNA polymerase V
LPRDNHLIVVPPRMNTYIEKNIEVNNIYREFVADEDLLPYSIDESILDITHSWKLFGDDQIAVVKKIQKTVHDRLKLVTTVGVGENPLQAKISMPSMIHASLARLPMTRSKIGIDFFMVKLNK